MYVVVFFLFRYTQTHLYIHHKKMSSHSPLLDDAPADAPPTTLVNAPVIDEPAVRRIAGARINALPVPRFDFRKESIQELILLRGLALHRPFMAPHGSGTDA